MTWGAPSGLPSDWGGSPPGRGRSEPRRHWAWRITSGRSFAAASGSAGHGLIRTGRSFTRRSHGLRAPSEARARARGFSLLPCFSRCRPSQGQGQQPTGREQGVLGLRVVRGARRCERRHVRSALASGRPCSGPKTRAARWTPVAPGLAPPWPLVGQLGLLAAGLGLGLGLGPGGPGPWALHSLSLHTHCPLDCCWWLAGGCGWWRWDWDWRDWRRCGLRAIFNG
jgi:hypothetical protein